MSEAPQSHTADSARIRRLEEELRESEDRQRLLAEGIRDFALFSMDPDGRITSWGQGARRLTDYETEDVIGRHSSILFTPEDRDRGLPQRELETAASDGSAADENWIVRKDGTRFWASGYSSARRGQDEGLLGFVKLFRDLSEKQKTLQALRESELRLRAALAAAEMGTWLWQVPTDKQTLDHGIRDHYFGEQPIRREDTVTIDLGI